MTVFEVMLAAVIFGGISAILMGLLLIGRTSYVSADASLQVQQEARRAFDAIVKELHGAGQVNNSVTIPEPGVQRLDFQIIRDYDTAACGGICWGTDDTILPNGWVHYVVDTADPQNVRLMRCITANRLDAIPVGFAGCRVLANRVNQANSFFSYDNGSGTVTVRLQIAIVSTQLPGGGMSLSPTALVTRVRLRNAL